jgi:hypothetical protein
MFRATHQQVFHDREEITGVRNVGQLSYKRKFNVEFTIEMSRSVRAILKAWSED